MAKKKSILNKLILIVCFLSFSRIVYCQAPVSGQKINDFYLSNYKADGTRDWEIEGEKAVLGEDTVNIDTMQAKYYSEDDTLSMKSQKATLNKSNHNIHLENDVHIENKDGIQLETNSLNWKKKENKVETDDWVDAQRQDLKIVAKGLNADTKFKNVNFEKNVEMTLSDKENMHKKPTTIICDGPLDIEYTLGRAIFLNNVIFENEEGKMFADKATVFFDTKEKKLLKVVAEGAVKIIKDENVTFANKATYLGKEERIVLEGTPRIIYFPQDNEETAFLQ